MTADTPPVDRGSRLRWVICGLLFFSIVVNYLHRLTISILKPELSRELGWSETDYGMIAAAQSFSYAFGYLFGGRIIDRIGPKRGLPIFVLLWTLAAIAHGFCRYLDVSATFSYPWFQKTESGLAVATLVIPMTVAGFVMARIALGLTQGANFPAAIKVVAEWFPVKERALATGWFNTGSNVGAVLCPLAVPVLFKVVGWEWTFYLTGVVGLLWLVAWKALYDEPEQHRKISASELAYIRAGQPAVEETPQRVPWLKLLSYRSVWAYVIASILAGPAWGFYQSFLPDFLNKRFHLNLGATGFWTAVFFALAAAGGVAGGWLSGKFMNQGWTLNKARKLTLLACAIAVVPIYFAPFASEVWMAVIIIGLAGSAHQGWSANLFSVVSDTMPKEAISSVVGLGGFVAYFTGGFVNGFTGLILQKTGSYVWVFAYFSMMYLLSLALLQLLVPRIQREKA
ncbi:MFS transporter [Oleiharenicola lentus]|uniref:MFS transporter n=1 Tax=Oleiharenicola lentus TaxID=2508720 RepID=UPI003F665F3B